jgi:pseudouridine synthase
MSRVVRAAESTMEERLQKLIARAGIASRRHAEQLILAGEVAVNGRVVKELGSRADPERDTVRVSGRVLRFPEEKTYLILNKPAGCVATMNDPEGRRTLRDFLRGVRGAVFPVGRLDYNAEGLLLLTSDGDLANRILQHGRLPQTYWLKVKSPLTPAELQEVAAKAGARLRLSKRGPNPWYEATLTEARRDALRNTLFRLGHPVEKTKRIRLANLELGKLAPGEYRRLTPGEVAVLRRALEGAGAERHPRPASPRQRGRTRERRAG